MTSTAFARRDHAIHCRRATELFADPLPELEGEIELAAVARTIGFTLQLDHGLRGGRTRGLGRRAHEREREHDSPNPHASIVPRVSDDRESC